MPYPPGVQTSTLTFSNPITFLGNEAQRTEVTVQPTAGVVWTATGQPIDDFAEIVAPGDGMPGSLTAPYVDQEGFTDQAGNDFTMWAYIVTRKTFFGSSMKTVKKNWQPILGQTTIDFDNLPGGAIGLPVAAPPVPVTSVAGLAGVVPAAALAGVLEEFLPAADDTTVADIVTTGPETVAALSATYGPVALGKSVADFGVAVANTAAQNVTAFRAAVEWAEDNPLGARTLFIPQVGASEFFAVNDEITVTGPGITIIGAGKLSRVKQTVKTTAIFRSCGPGQRFENFHVIGADDRTLVDGGGLDMVRDQHPFGNHVGIAFQYGSDGSSATRISGHNINAVVACWGWDDTADDYVANIQGLTIRDIRGENVWAVVFGREVDDLTVENISGSYSRIPGIFADPHLIYLTSSNYVGSLRPLYKVRVSNVRAYDSVGGEPVAIKNIYGGSLSGLNVRDCPGIGVFAELDGFTIEPFVAEEIWKDPLTVGTAHSTSGGQSGMLTFSNCKNVTVAPGSRQRNKVGDQAKAIVFASTPECENVTVYEPYIETHHTTNDTADNRATVYVYGINCRVVRPVIKMLGAYRHGIRMGGTSSSVVDPEIIGCAQAIITDASLGSKIYDFNASKITRADTTIPTPIRLNATTDVLAESFTTPPPATVWGRGFIGSPTGRLSILSSGHKPTLFGAAFQVNSSGRWNCLSASATLPKYAVFEHGSADAYVESDVWLGAIDGGGSGTYSVGHALRVVQEDINLMVELRPDRLSVTYRAAGGLTLTSVASVLATYHIGRKYVLRSMVFGDNVQVFVDGVKIIDATLTAPQVTALATGTKHGIMERQCLAAQWTNYRSASLA